MLDYQHYYAQYNFHWYFSFSISTLKLMKKRNEKLRRYWIYLEWCSPSKCSYIQVFLYQCRFSYLFPIINSHFRNHPLSRGFLWILFIFYLKCDRTERQTTRGTDREEVMCLTWPMRLRQTAVAFFVSYTYVVKYYYCIIYSKSYILKNLRLNPSNSVYVKVYALSTT